MTLLGGEAILKKIEYQNFDVLLMRPKLEKLDLVNLFLRLIYK